MTSLKIVVTGASGFIGSQVSLNLARKFPNFSVIGIGRRNILVDNLDFQNYEYVTCDLMNVEMHKCLPSSVDVLIHLAGDRRTFVKLDDYSPQAVSNIMMTSRVADYAFLAKAKLFIYSSSVYVYSGNSTLPFKEDSFDIPGENLGATKLASESLLKARAVAGQFKALSFRIGTVYGPGASRRQFIPQAIIKLSSPDPVAKFGKGDVKRDFIFIDDVVRAFTSGLKLLEKNFTYNAMNVGTNVPTSIREVVQILADLLGSKKQIKFSKINKAANKADTDHQLDISMIHSVLKWQPEVSLREGLHKTIKSFVSD